MLSMSIKHPDVEEFITKKQDLSKVTGANISVKVTDDFMQAVLNDEDYYLRYPVDQDLSYFSKDYLDVEYDKLVYLEDHKNNDKVFYIKRIRAKKLWNILMHCAWNTAEPGILFEDLMHDYSPDGVYKLFRMISTNPCGEIPLGAYDSCRLIHANLTSVVKRLFESYPYVDSSLLYKIFYEATRLADDLIDLEMEAVDRIIDSVKDTENKVEFTLWNKIKETALNGRRVGIGFTGLADALAMLNLRYGSDESLEKVEDMMIVMMSAQLDATIDMAIERGSFPAFNPALEFGPEGGNKWFDYMKQNFPKQMQKMQKFGRRNLSWSTVAPTGTVSIMAGCSSGIEPVFLPYYQRKKKCTTAEERVDYVDIKGEKYTLFTVVHPKLKNWLQSQFPFLTPEELEERINDLEYLEEAFTKSPYYHSTATEINWRQRVKMQGLIQKYITHSISSTVNLPKKTTEADIADIYIEAWKAGNKGQTIYRDGCREGVLTKIEKPLTIEDRKAPKRPKELEADYYQVRIKGEQFIVLVGLLNGKPYEIFAFRPLVPVNIAPHKGKLVKKSKMHYGFDSPSINLSDLQLANDNVEEKGATLYASMLLRHGVSIEYIIKTAKKVNDNISSFSSAMCRILSKYVASQEVGNEKCPDCGGKLVREGGCIHCMDCDYSRCN